MAVDLNPGSNWTAIAAGRPAGETYTIKAGTHRMQTLPYRAGDKILIEPSTVMTGASAGSPTIPVTSYVFDGLTHDWPGGVTIACTQSAPRNAWPIVQYYKGNGNEGALRLRPLGANPPAQNIGYLVERLIIRFINDGAGTGTGIRLPRNSLMRLILIHDCLQYCFGLSQDSVFEDGEYYNGGIGTDPNKGGVKISNKRSTMRRVFGHDCGGGGTFWLDEQAGEGTIADAVVLEDCDLENPNDNAVNHEISRWLILRRCRFTFSGTGGVGLLGAAVQCRAGGGVHMEDSVLYGCNKQFGFNQTGRGDENFCRDHLYRNNDIYVLDGAASLLTGGHRGSLIFDPYAASANNKWERNRYHVADTISPRFMWKLGGVENSLLTFAQWQAAGMDVLGSLDFFDADNPPSVPSSMSGGGGSGSPPPPPGDGNGGGSGGTGGSSGGGSVGTDTPTTPLGGRGRELSAAVIDAITREHNDSADLMYFGFQDLEVFLALHPTPVRFRRPGTWVGFGGSQTDATEQIWQPVGGAIIPGPVVESAEFNEQGQDVQFTVIDPGFDFLGRILRARHFMRRYQYWRVYFETSGPNAGKIYAAWMPCGGYLNGGWDVEDANDENGLEPGTTQVKFRVTSPMGLIGDLRRSIQTNERSHERHFEGDRFFDQVKYLQHRRIFFGEAGPDAPTGGKVR